MRNFKIQVLFTGTIILQVLLFTGIIIYRYYYLLNTVYYKVNMIPVVQWLGHHVTVEIRFISIWAFKKWIQISIYGNLDRRCLSEHRVKVICKIWCPYFRTRPRWNHGWNGNWCWWTIFSIWTRKRSFEHRCRA